jgi:hypothetical protein
VSLATIGPCPVAVVGGRLAEVVDPLASFHPDAVDPSTLVGAEAHVHVELVDVDGLELADDRVLSIGEVPCEPDGP